MAPILQESRREKDSASAGNFLTLLLQEQRSLTAVELFAQRHDESTPLAHEQYYRDLIPSGLPSAGEQYAFEVDLDACSGCKACVAACHSLNGLEENETWRNVGQLIGVFEDSPAVSHVTTACHHCVDPACLNGCPTLAYEKDPVTGIVRHLDDQCFGCQYCVWMCPYEVPVYSPSKGIVRKCDMCHQRLAAQEAPACVQSCPNQAIKIRTVSKDEVEKESKTGTIVPGAPASRITQPTTQYVSEQNRTHDTEPADGCQDHPAHGHSPLVVMLVLSQLSVGGFLIEFTLSLWNEHSPTGVGHVLRPWLLASTLGVGLIGLTAALFHLGRPFLAHRAWLGWRKSWLSREILAFNGFAGAASAYVAAVIATEMGVFRVPVLVQTALGAGTVFAGFAAVFCSVMIYVKTQRPVWTGPRTGGLFFGTSLVLGAAFVLAVMACVAVLTNGQTAKYMTQSVSLLSAIVLGLSIAKLAFEASLFRHLHDIAQNPWRRTATLLAGPLRKKAAMRFAWGVVGGILLPGFIWFLHDTSTGNGSEVTNSAFFEVGIAILAVASCCALILGELFERYLFFVAAPSPRMPGGPA